MGKNFRENAEILLKALHYRGIIDNYKEVGSHTVIFKQYRSFIPLMRSQNRLSLKRVPLSLRLYYRPPSPQFPVIFRLRSFTHVNLINYLVN